MGVLQAATCLLAVSVSLVAALPGPRSVSVLARAVSDPPSTPTNACAEIASLAQKHDFDEQVEPFTFPGRLAYDCLGSMPFESDKASVFATELNKLLQFHSTIDLLPAPPAGYLGEAVNLTKEMQQIVAAASTVDGYSSHYAFETAIISLWNRARDGHLMPNGMCSTSMFMFSRGISLVSLSSNGVEKPQIYDAMDAFSLSKDSKAKVSSIRKINGQPPESFLEGIANTAQLHDPHARYNMMFDDIQASITNVRIGGFNEAAMWPGVENTEIEWSNGTYQRYPTMAKWVRPGFNYTSGQELYEDLCVVKPALLGSPSQSPDPAKAENTPMPSRWPKPLVKTPNNHLAGFYPRSLPDTAVLTIPSVDDAPNVEAYYDFVETAVSFVEGAVKDGKQRMIIDLSSNGGGSVSVAESLFRLFFPKKLLPGVSTFRAHTGAQWWSEAWELMIDTGAYDDLPMSGTPFLRRDAIKPDQNTNFDTFVDYYGPQTLLNSNYSSFFVLNETDTAFPVLGSGLMAGKEPSEQPFKSENIVLVTNGICASSCNTIVEMMRQQGGVKTLVLGGRSTGGPMEAVGGTKGSQVLEYTAIEAFWAAVNNGPGISSDVLEKLKELLPPSRDSLPYSLGPTAGTNLLNYYKSPTETTPLQFISEPANCRLYYTAEMWFEPETLWKAVYDGWWGSGLCVQGSVN